IAADVERKLRGISETIEKVADAGEQVEELASGEADPDVEEVVLKSPDMLTRLAASAPYLVAQSIFMLVLLFFITASGDLFYAKIVEASPTFRAKRRAIGITRDIEKRISRYFLTISVVNAGLGASIGLTLWWLGMPNPLLFGVMAFALNFIPYLGALAGVAVTFAIGIVSFPTLGDALVVAAAYLALTTLEGQLITPYAIGRRLSLNPVIVFIAVAFWGWAWSVIGMFIAVPLLIVALVISERVEGLEGLAIFLSGERLPEPSEEEREAT
ncbi:MAG: AI-2E family transporter, partial [Silicimonas sp.]|nr:AI-2E family transporter [Silicimonas sp.]